MSASSAAKGKARAIDPELDCHNAAPTTDAGLSRHIKPQPIPSTTLLNIEYPGILSYDSSYSPRSYPSLDRALSTLHPSALPPLTSSSCEGLNFLSKIPNEGVRLVECRLGGFGDQNKAGGSSSSASAGRIDDVYRAPLIGEAVPTNNVVIRVVKRVWRQKKRKRAFFCSPSPRTAGLQQDVMALDPALFADTEASPAEQPANGHIDPPSKQDRYTGGIKKEYCIEILGLATNTVRFRSMADFAFQPSISTSSTSDPGAVQQLDPVMSLHKALATMDLEAFQNFRVPAQLEDYQIPDPPTGQLRSNLHMVPPAFFSRMDVPFNYGFQQTPYSELRTVAAPPHLRKPPGATSFAHALKRDDLAPGQMQRFVNRVRLSNIAPQPFRPGRDTKIPTKAMQDVIRIEHRCDPAVLARLKELLNERPIWSRVALKNQLSDAEVRELHGYNEKVYYALVGYSMVGGPWRDAIVRFGYDVRKNADSRIYQRIFLRGGPATRESRLNQQGGADKEEDQGEEDDADEQPPPRSSTVPIPGKERARNTHIFDGVTLHRNIGNFHLCDIEDPLIMPFIWRGNDEDLPAESVLPENGMQLEPMGIEWLRKTWDAETGWYTKRALELIRALLGARFKALAETGRALEKEAVDGIVGRLRRRWSEEDLAMADSRGEGEVDGMEENAGAGAGMGLPTDPAFT
ncbi:hypothetical protein NDA12_002091 [Ustilago hordei]|nr:hypothetical protein NDA15_005577 [Ustilago hordei]KAJ1582745.1 hypothetical protein NDA12_002091 [Ustilago hordei]